MDAASAKERTINRSITLATTRIREAASAAKTSVECPVAPEVIDEVQSALIEQGHKVRRNVFGNKLIIRWG